MFNEGRLRSLCVPTILVPVALAALALLAPSSRADDPCLAPANAIVAENCQPGNPQAEWDVSGAGDTSIQGFATAISVNRGETVRFKINTNAAAYRIDIYRLGYYQGNGARKIATVFPSATLPQTQPACLTDSATLLTDCGNWAESASWAVPGNAMSGIYLARLVRTDTSGASHIAFIVRDDASTSDLLVKTSDTTWQAYNTWGGSSLYVGPARKVSYNRPFQTRGDVTEDWLFNAEYPMVRWLEANGYDVTYTTDIDTDKYGAAGPNRILTHKAFLSVGHDEYWSAGERAAVEAARDAGAHLAFFSGNEIYWKIRWEPSTDPSATPHRTLVCYKEGTMGENTCGSRCDPNLDNVWTGLWRAGCEYPSLDGCRPENALSGNISWVGSTGAIQVPQIYGGLRFWRNTSVAALAAGQIATLAGGSLGYEWDFLQYESAYPPGRIRISETTMGGLTHHMSLYRHYSGGNRRGLVFGAGTVQWSWGLDGNHDRGGSTPDVRMRQATVNLLADMGVQPASLQAPLVASAASTDIAPPTSTIDAPLAGSTVQINVPITISGVATDVDGVVGVVEISVDGGATWRPAQGRDVWSYAWTPSAYGGVTIRSRAADDSGNIETPGAGVTVTVGDTPSGPPNVPVAIPESYATNRNVPLSVPAPGVLANDTDPNLDPLTAVLRTGATHGTLTLNANGSFAYTPATDWAGRDSFTYRAKDPDDNLSAPATVAIDVAQTCPCTIFAPTSEPVSPRESDPNALEVGVRFRSDVNGYVTAVRFYKHPENTGTHTAHVWTAAGALLATESFVGESASGWQEVTLANPVQVTAGATYIASYHSATGYAQDMNVFASAGVDNPPLHALQDGVAGPNGIYTYCAAPGCFPTSGYQSSNYYVDVVFALSVGPDTTPPTVTSVVPAHGATNVAVTVNVVANFSEAIDPATIDGTTFELRDGLGAVVSATVTYSAAARQAVLDPSASLAYATTYTATVKGALNDPRVEDLAGNPLAADRVWSFTTGSPPPPGPNEGPGGPILVVASSTNPFTRYFAEILRNEGLNYFTVSDIQNVTSTVLASYRTVILGELALDAAQVTLFTDWVTGGGRLIAMRPDKKLAGLLGLTDTGATLANAYLLIDTSSQPGLGLVGQSIQFHGTADRYTPNGATVLATLYADAATATSNPAVTLRAVGAGRAVAFTFDLARSVVYTRQGNPAWAGDERDGVGPLRSDDMFYGAKSGDPQPDWIDLNKVAIPQADEQQRLFAKLIQHMDAMPLPRFWFLPSMKKAAVVMTGDQHGCCGGTRTRFQTYETQSPTGCSLADWECIRASSYVYINGDMGDAEAVGWHNKGFELGIHLDTGCGNYTPEGVDTLFTNQLAAFSAQLPSLPRQGSHRTHCIAWSGWTVKAEKEAAHGIRLDVNYYFWPPGWVANRPGMFTGSGMPMRFAQLDGTMVDVYQAVTQMTDESGQSFPYTIDTLLDRALGPEGYYGVFTANMHTDSGSHAGSDAIVASAKARGIPVVSGRQMLEWLDGRNASTFGDLSWDGNTLSFSVTAAAGARNLKGMVPRNSSVGVLTGITRGGTPIAYATETIKGVEYAIFDATTQTYGATYAVDSTPPVITNVNAVPGFGGTAVITWDTATEPSDSRVDYGTAPGALTAGASNGTMVNAHTITLTGLLPSTTYYYRVTSKDAVTNSATSPDPLDPPLSFTTPSAAFLETTVANFSAGTTGACSYVSETADGEVILAPAEGSEFSGASIPAGWTVVPWAGGGGVTFGGGRATLSAARLDTVALYPAGRVVEFVATFSGAPNQHVGLGIDFSQGVWAIFSTMGSGGLWARTNGPSSTDTPIAGSWLGTPHRFRIVWTPSAVTFFIDGSQVASHSVAIASDMGPIASDYVAADGDLVVDWMRMSPYPASCSYLSRILDAGQAVNWGAMTWTAATPAGTSLAMYVRRGNTPAADESWTGWTPVASPGSTIGGQAQYLQYRADLTTTDTTTTPTLESVTLGYTLGLDTTPPTITGRSPAPGATGVSPGSDVVVQFDETMNGTSINGATFTLRAVGAGSNEPAVASCTGATATLNPDAALVPGQEYRVTVSGAVNDVAGNALGADDTWTFAVYADTVPPTITGRSPDPGATGVDVATNVVVSFSEEMNASTITPTSLMLREVGTGSDVPAAVTYAGTTATLDPTASLLPGRTYRVTVSGSVQDLAGNALGADDTWTFSTPTSASASDTTAAEFSAALTNTCAVVVHTGDGEATLAPAIDVEFSGTSLPSGWATYVWPGQAGSAVVSNGSIVVDGARVDPYDGTPTPDGPRFGPGRSLEFAATFTAVPYQHVGFGGGNHLPPTEVFNTYPWAMFSTGSGGTALQARTVVGTENNVTIPGSWLGAPHIYRIDWNASNVDFHIDGILRHTSTDAIATNMRPAIGDYNAGGSTVTVDWLRMSPYASPCAVESRIFDGGYVVDWATLTATGQLPSGTSYAFETRTGNTPVPDGSWSAWAAVAGATIASPGAKYLQYRATLTTTDSRVSPELQRVDIGYNVVPDATPPTITGRTPAPGAVDVTKTTNVLLQFSEPMNPATIDGSTITLRAVGAGSDVPAVVTYSGVTTTLDPVDPLTPGEEYRVTVSGSVADLSGNLLGADDTWTFRVYVDLVPPTVTGRSPAPGATGIDANANVTVQFSEPMNPATIDSTTVRLRATGAGSDVPAVVTYAGFTATLDPTSPLSVATVYHVTVSGSVTDANGNPLGASDTWTFATTYPQAFADTTSADFSAGSPDGCSVVAHTGDGEVTLMPTIGEEFSGPGLPAGWASYDWPFDGVTGSVSVSGGSVVVDGTRVDPDPAAYAAGRSLEFVGTFGAQAYQHVGFGAGNHAPPGEIYNTTPWAMFSTAGTTNSVLARTWSNSGNIDYTIPGSAAWIGTPHRYKIVWTASNATYFVDGTQVASQAYSHAATMRPAISDLNQGTATLGIDWMRMSPYGSPCAFESRVFDAGKLVRWTTLTATGSLPSVATAYTFETRTGNVPVPDGTWTSWTPVIGTAISAPNSRYLQYRATLSTTDSLVTPELQRVDLAADACVPEVCNNLDDDCDGNVDNGNPGGGGACTTGQSGVCAAGTTQCTGGALACVPNVAPSSETCNGLDDDCDGAVDEGGAASCDDGNSCTDDNCAGTSGCVHTNNTAPCNDGNACTQADTCVAGACVGSNPIVCTDGNACTDDLCDPVAGCIYPNDDANACSDGDPCTSGDHCVSGACTFAAFSCDVGGHVYYYRDSTDPEGVEDTSTKGVGPITLAMTGRATGTTASADPGGDYHFSAGGSVTVAPQAKLGMFQNGISSLDASRIAQSSVESIVLTPRQQIAAEVSGNARITSYDAALVAQFVVSLIPRFPVADIHQSDWAYVPASRTYTVGGNVGDADFLGILYGDVTANWGEAAAFRSVVSGQAADEDPAGRRWLVEQAAASARRAVTPASKQAVIHLASGPKRLPDGRFEVVLGIRGADGILAIDLSLALDPAVVHEVSVERTGLSSGMALTQNGRPGRHAVSLYGVAPMQGAGPFLKVVYRAAGLTLAPPFSVTAEANEGQVPLTAESTRLGRAVRR